MPLLYFMKKLGFLREHNTDIDEMVLALRQQQASIREDVPLVKNEAKQLARSLQGRLAVIYGAETVAEAAHRWKTQINENSKAWAFHEVFPEMNHNSVVGFEFPPAINNRILVIMLASPFFTPRVQLRYEIVSRMLGKANIDFKTVHGCGNSRLSEMVSLVLLGDYISYYLALLNGTDPTPVRTIDYLKEELAGK
jgi:glucose/mannose-6-phosphate isomerase